MANIQRPCPLETITQIVLSLTNENKDFMKTFLKDFILRNYWAVSNFGPLTNIGSTHGSTLYLHTEISSKQNLVSISNFFPVLVNTLLLLAWGTFCGPEQSFSKDLGVVFWRVFPRLGVIIVLCRMRQETEMMKLLTNTTLPYILALSGLTGLK